ncbi:MAG: cache domain-containing protein [Proteobacteria bacterium]|nr:cache domain-containing protein [Pseudomonadota bacterium]MBU1581996.1 cache domain-containing protein [Pseudomonadota bacterium]MBU2452425.1 cache domain-containing protein [Pseudomonadota bacterium]
MEAKKDVIVEQIQTVTSILQNYAGLEQQGLLTKEKAQLQAKEILRKIRYSKNQENYFFIVDKDVRSVMHPLRESLEGHDMKNIKDRNNKKYILAMVDVVKKQGHGFVTYSWYLPQDKEKTVPKLAYVQLFEPWGWIIGTGIYVYDIENMIKKEKHVITQFFIGFIFILFILAVFIVFMGVETEKRRILAETKLKANGKKYHMMFEGSHDVIILVKPHGRIVDSNTKAYELFKIPDKKQFLSKTIADLSPEYQPDGNLSGSLIAQYIDQAVKKTSAYFEWVYTKSDGTQFDATVLVSKISLPDGVVLQVTIRDITERKAAQTRIAELSEINLRVIENSPIGISAYDQTGQCVLANKAMSNIVGGTYQEILSQNYNRIESWKGSGLLDMAKLTITDGEVHTKEINVTSTFGKQIFMTAVMARFVLNHQLHLLLLVENSTQKVLYQNAIKEQNKLLEKSNQDLQDFAYIASHDLQEPLRKIVAFGDLLSEENGSCLSSDGKDYLMRMQNSARRLGQFIQDLLAYSRISTQAKSPVLVDLNDVLSKVLLDFEIIIKETGAKITADALPKIEAEPLHMYQLFQNLIGNSLKYRREDVSPVITITHNRPGGGFIEFHFQDNGIGFEQEYDRRIFQPFQRLHGRSEYSGTGIGLAVCWKIILHHNGRIKVVSSPEKGTVFIVSLPEKQSKEIRQ